MTGRFVLGALVACACGAAAASMGGCGVLGPRTVERRIELEVGQTHALRLRWAQPLTEKKLWQYRVQEFSSAEHDPRQNRLFIGNRLGQLYCLDATDGHVLWTVKLRGAVSSRPRYLPETDTLLVGDDDGSIYRIDASTGRKRWRYATKGTINARPLYADGLVYAMNNDEYLYAIDFATGQWRWHYHREPPEQFTVHGVGTPIFHQGKIIVGFADGYLVALSPREGGVLWARYLAPGPRDLVDVDSTPLAMGGVLYVSSFAGGVNAVDPADGRVLWSTPVEGASSVASDGERLYVVAPSTGLHCLTKEGQLLWRQAIPDGSPTAPTVYGNLVAFTVGDKGLYVADKRSGEIREFLNPGEGIAAPVSRFGDRLYVMSNLGTLYAYDLVP